MVVSPNLRSTDAPRSKRKSKRKIKNGIKIKSRRRIKKIVHASK